MSARITKVLIANRGEIAVRVMRAAKDAGIATVAVYANQDINSQHVKMADEAISLHGTTSADTYLVIAKILAAAKRTGANAIHPGYGFLSENADFARAVVDAGIIWIGPTPEAIERLGDKVSARHVAQKVGAPLAPGTLNPVETAQEVLDFVDVHGLPVAIKAAFGGGGRGLKVVHTREEIPEQFESATREAIAAFGRGECFVEKYLDKPRHVETQCLADHKGNVVVVSTRDCSLQRRHQKLVEEAPAPFLTDAQRDLLYSASKNILKEVGYVGAGTCEFLIGADGTITFLEVNTRLQVEHPVSEEVTGLDLVREQFRIAEGGLVDYPDPIITGHSIEFRINGEDAGANFRPTPGPIKALRLPGGPGIRVDAGFVPGDVISGSFDSLLAKLIVTGRDRKDALAKARRALSEFQVVGLPTVLPFHQLVVNDPAFAPVGDEPFAIYTSWIETEFNNTVAEYAGLIGAGEATDTRHDVVVEVDGKRIAVSVPDSLLPTSARIHKPLAPVRSTAVHASGASGNDVASPMQATVVKVEVAPGDVVVKGQTVVVLEAMKMEQAITATRDGVVAKVSAEVGTTVKAGFVLLSLEKSS